MIKNANSVSQGGHESKLWGALGLVAGALIHFLIRLLRLTALLRRRGRNRAARLPPAPPAERGNITLPFVLISLLCVRACHPASRPAPENETLPDLPLNFRQLLLVYLALLHIAILVFFLSPRWRINPPPHLPILPFLFFTSSFGENGMGPALPTIRNFNRQMDGVGTDFDPRTPSGPNNANGPCTTLSEADYPWAEGSPGAREQQHLIGAAIVGSPPPTGRRIWPPPDDASGRGSRERAGEGGLEEGRQLPTPHLQPHFGEAPDSRQPARPPGSRALWPPASDRSGTLTTVHNPARRVRFSGGEEHQPPVALRPPPTAARSGPVGPPPGSRAVSRGPSASDGSGRVRPATPPAVRLRRSQPEHEQAVEQYIELILGPNWPSDSWKRAELELHFAELDDAGWMFRHVRTGWFFPPSAVLGVQPANEQEIWPGMTVADFHGLRGRPLKWAHWPCIYHPRGVIGSSRRSRSRQRRTGREPWRAGDDHCDWHSIESLRFARPGTNNDNAEDEEILGARARSFTNRPFRSWKRTIRHGFGLCLPLRAAPCRPDPFPGPAGKLRPSAFHRQTGRRLEPTGGWARTRTTTSGERSAWGEESPGDGRGPNNRAPSHSQFSRIRHVARRLHHRHRFRRVRRNATTWTNASVLTRRPDPAETGNTVARGRRHRSSLRAQHRPPQSGTGGCGIASGRTASGDSGSEASGKMAAPAIRLPAAPGPSTARPLGGSHHSQLPTRGHRTRAEDDDAARELADLEEEDWELDEAACSQPGTSQMPPVPEDLTLREAERYVCIDEDDDWESCKGSPTPPASTSGAGGNVAK
uniref:Uncharacterized protein n=1 Tax=Globodera rostochiensis TaxID=31243 RepID=A0A914GNZ2_GLORO